MAVLKVRQNGKWVVVGTGEKGEKGEKGDVGARFEYNADTKTLNIITE